MLIGIILISQLILTVLMILYFLSAIKKQKANVTSIIKDSDIELNKIKRKEEVKLSIPLTETARPKNLSEIIGQKEGVTNLKAIMCSENPQHVIIYGPPGVGKTAAARAVFECAKNSPKSPFDANAKFIEIDATTVQYDERSIADPLIGCVHDPIYQGAGAYGPAGVPQPKAGAVTKAHGGILFIDEIGELPPTQMNRLLKVLEDRRVYFESSYYTSGDPNIPNHIHYIFNKGLPADFRLIGATTRSPEEINPALRSRCVEIFFNPLSKEELASIGDIAAKKAGLKISFDNLRYAACFSKNGRDMVNVVQMAVSIAKDKNKLFVDKSDIQWVADSCRYTSVPDKRLSKTFIPGKVAGLGVSQMGGSIIDIEVSAQPGSGKFLVTGIIEKEEFDARGQKLSKRSSAVETTENIITVLKNFCSIDCSDYNIHINIPNAAPVDGPSAGVAMLCGVYSAITGCSIKGKTVLTGELSILGDVLPVGGIKQKLEAAYEAGAELAIIPYANKTDAALCRIKHIEYVSNIKELFNVVFNDVSGNNKAENYSSRENSIVAAKHAER